jgi:hypothetical protein
LGLVEVCAVMTDRLRALGYVDIETQIATWLGRGAI